MNKKLEELIECYHECEKCNQPCDVVRGLKVLSLFDGISCARVAIERAGFKVEDYFVSEIDKYAIQISLKNFPDNIVIGDVKSVCGYDYTNIDLLIGGSPCQDLSIAKKNREGLVGNRSSLFWEYVRILKKVKPKYFILENVDSMPKEAKAIITETLGVEPIIINAALVSAQNRKRLFWTNIKGVTQPEDKEIYLKDILENNVDAKYLVGKDFKLGNSLGNRVYVNPKKSVTLKALGGGGGAKTGLYLINGEVRKLTPIECERLQGLPDNYTAGISNTQRYKCLGNAFNVDVVSHILSFIKEQND